MPSVSRGQMFSASSHEPTNWILSIVMAVVGLLLAFSPLILPWWRRLTRNERDTDRDAK
jgi:hypothetical protein